MAARCTNQKRDRRGMTLIELLVVISILGILMAMLMPAVNSARESARQATCQNNLRQFGVGLQAHATRFQTYCSGAFSWRNDGAVTEVGWVADLVNTGVPVGKMLCPSNPGQISETYNELITLDPSIDTCVNRLGTPASTAPDGTTQIVNPCRALAGMGPSTSDRQTLIQSQIFNGTATKKGQYNTNYTSSWFLVRSGAVVDASGNLASQNASCAPSLDSLGSTLGPLTQARADAAACPSSAIPLLGCGAATGAPLAMQISSQMGGTPTVKSYTAGPVAKTTMYAPTFSSGASYSGAGGWWDTWTNQVLQDYRNFSPVHRGTCCLLFADGSVRTFSDQNNDGFLNNGFPASTQTKFHDGPVELAPDEVYSLWSLKPPQ
jgi:prepilin-type N-terminal cleavage/methylation domain-containing protein